LKRAAIYKILKAVKEGKNTDDQRHLNSKKTKRTPALIASVAAAVEEDRRQTIKALATAMVCPHRSFSVSSMMTLT
jgi:hypothetical protein